MSRGCQVFIFGCYCCAFMLLRHSPASTLKQMPPAPDWRCLILGGESVPPLECQERFVASSILPSSPSTASCLWKGLVGLCSSSTAPRRARSALPDGNSALLTSCTSTCSAPRLLLQGCPVLVCFSLAYFGKLCFCSSSSVLGPASLYVKNPKSYSAQYSSNHINTSLWVTGG